MPQNAIRAGFARLRLEVAAFGAAVILVVLITGWYGDYRSCRRSDPVRDALIFQRETNRGAIGFWEARGEKAIAQRLRARVKADEHLKSLHCGFPLSGT